MKKALSLIVLVVVLLTFALTVAACGNSALGASTLNYIVICEGGKYVLHKVENWSHSGYSDIIGARLLCCGNYVWTQNAVLYQDIPRSSAYDIMCY